MNKKLNQSLSILFLLTATNLSFGQKLKVSDNLFLQELSERCFVHIQGNNNGIVYINQGKAVIVSTPNSDIETQNLIDWVRNTKSAEIVGYIIDRWHPDAMEGLDIVKKNGIKNYACNRTRQIAREKGLPIPHVGFTSKKSIKVGNEKIICHYLGEAHTSDGIVVWIPSEQTLFGGNEIRNYNGWIGNIGDANLEKWSETAQNVKQKYGSAKVVVPGHGKPGGTELIDYTIDLYDIPKTQSTTSTVVKSIKPEFKTNDEFYIKSESDSLQDGKRILNNGVVIVQDSAKLIELASDHIIYQPDKKRIDSEIGSVRIYDKIGDREVLRTDVDFKDLIIVKVDDYVGFAVVLKEIIHNNR